MIRKSVIVLLTLGAVGTSMLCVASWFVRLGVVQLVVADDHWIWLTAYKGIGAAYVLERNERLDPQELPRPRRRISFLSRAQFWCYAGAADSVPPFWIPADTWPEFLRVFCWWVRDRSFPDTTLTTDNCGGSSGKFCAEPLSIPGRAVRHLQIGVRLWAVATALAIYPIIAFIRGPLRRARRRRRGQCLDCGYDLTGNLSGTCPECGSPVDRG